MVGVGAKYKKGSVEIKKMSAEEFRRGGYLQELNRQFLHPLGLALEIVIDGDTGEAVSFGQIWDYRNDPEGLVYGENVKLDVNAAARIWFEQIHKSISRMARLGYVQQPIKSMQDAVADISLARINESGAEEEASADTQLHDED